MPKDLRSGLLLHVSHQRQRKQGTRLRQGGPRVLGASRAGVRLYVSAAHGEQTDDESDHDELEGDA